MPDREAFGDQLARLKAAMEVAAVEGLGELSSLHRRRITTPHKDGPHDVLKEEWILLGPRGAMDLLAWHAPEGTELAEHCRRVPEIYSTKPGDGAYWGVVIGVHSPQPLRPDSAGGAAPSENCHILEGRCYTESDGWEAIQLVGAWRESDFDDDVIYGGLLVEYIAKFLQEDVDG